MKQPVKCQTCGHVIMMDQEVQDAILLLKKATDTMAITIVETLITKKCCEKPCYSWVTDEDEKDAPTIWSIK